MPSVSKAQQITAAIAENEPEKLYPENKGMANMSKGELHKFASTKRKGLPYKKKSPKYAEYKKQQEKGPGEE